MATGDHDDADPGEIILCGGSAVRVERIPRPAQPLAHRSAKTYFACAILNPYHLIMLSGALLLCLISWSLWALMVELGAEVLLVGVLPWCGFFRSRADVHLDRADRAAALRAREAMIQRMAEGHRHELLRLDALVDKTRESLVRQGRTLSPLLGDGTGLDRLTTRYIRLAIAHRACEETLAMTDYRALQGTIRALETARDAPVPRVRRVVERRLTVAHKRVECWGRAKESLELITHQLATILELVQLAYEESLAPVDAGGLCADVDRFLHDVDVSERTEREIGELSMEEPIPLYEDVDEGRVSFSLPRR